MSSLLAPADVTVTTRADGSILFNAVQPLGQYPRCITEHLVRWAREAPDRSFLLERSEEGGWQGVTYAQALRRIERIGGALLAMELSPERPIVILSEAAVEHGLLTLAALHIGIPVAPISAAYSLVSRDFRKLQGIVRRLAPSLIYVDNFERYAPALQAIADSHDAVVIVGGGDPGIPANVLRLADLDRPDERAVRDAFGQITPDTIAKILFTSGSTDEPKGVVNTQRMLCASQQAKAQVWPFLEREPPVIVDWLPWNHTFGGNHNFNLVLRNGGTLYVDAGRPVPALFAKSVSNLLEVAPTIYFNVPRGYEMLVPALQADPRLRDKFFSRLQLIFYAAASLPSHLWDALTALSIQATGKAIPLISGWGSTETAPMATDGYGGATGPGVIGLPVPGCELKLLPSGRKLEVRVRGPNVFPGYWGRPDLTVRHFDEEGFYLIGDAVRFRDDGAPERGLVFDGRVSEDFKLTSGTWVSVGNLRLRAITALSPVAQDVVVAGHDRAAIRFMVFPNAARCRALCPELAPDAPLADVLAHPNVRHAVATGLKSLRQGSSGSSTYAIAAIFLCEPPSIDGGEITDKGYINQRAVLTRRQDLVEVLFTPDHPDVIPLLPP